MSVHLTKTKECQYYFRGTRTYVEGKIIFSSFCDLLLDAGIDNFFVKEIRFPQKLFSNGLAVIFKDRKELETLDAKQLNTYMSIIVEGQEIYLCLFADETSPVRVRKEERENPYIQQIDYMTNFESIVQLNGITSFPILLSTMVDSNKNTHIHTLGDTDKSYEYSWTYLKNLYVDLHLKFPEEIEIRIKNLGIKKNERQEGYTLNRLSFMLGGREYQTDMCYRFVKREIYK